MIPILYEGTETNFTSNGLGRLADAISCKVVEERNATYELEMVYPISGVHYSDLAENRIILAQPFDGGQTQPFIIYKITKPLNGIVTVNAEHISYRLAGIPVMPFTANSCVSALAGLKNNSAVTNPFTFTTDKTTTGDFNVTVPTSCRQLLCGSAGSILDVFGTGDYEFNRFTVNLRQHRGADNHVTLRYGKNITDLKSELDTTNVYTGIAPYWANESTVVTLPEKVVLSAYASSYPYKIIKPVDFSERWEEAPTEAQLRAAAQSYVENNEGWKVRNNITVSFVALWNTEEYKDIAPLERVKMCDTVKVVYSKLGVDFSTKVVKTDYNVLLERYNEITLGDTYYSLNQVFTEEIKESQQEQLSYFQKAIAHGTALITGGLGGYVYMKPNADGQPEELLIMDKPDIAQAVRMIRMNKNGIGFSDNGYDGPFNTAWTIENNTGHFYADFIDAGTFNANLIQAGKIQPIVNGVASANYWDMLTGDFQLSSAVKVGDSTVASVQNISSSINTYDNKLNQLKVFNKLTVNGTKKGIYMNASTNDLYVNASYIKSGAMEVGGNNMMGSITLKNASGSTLGIWDNTGMTMYDGNGTASGNRTGYWNTTGLNVFKGTLTGATIQNASSGQRVVIDDKCSIKGYNNSTLHNFINFAQAISGYSQMTIESDNQLNIRTPKLCVVKGYYGENTQPVDVYETQNDTDGEYDNDDINGGRKCWRIYDIYKIMKNWPYNNDSRVQELDLMDVGQQTGSVHVTLPVLLEIHYKKERRRLGMVTTENVYSSYVN